MSGGSKVQTTRTEPWEQQKPFLERGFEYTKDLYGSGALNPAYYGGETVAGFTQAQKDAQQATLDYAGSPVTDKFMGAAQRGLGGVLDYGAGAMGRAETAAQPLTQTQYSTFTPFEDQQYQDLLAGRVDTDTGPFKDIADVYGRQAMGQLTGEVLPGIRSAMVQSQAGGGTRGDIVQANAIAAANQQMTDNIAKAQFDAYNRAQGMRMPAAQMGLGAQQQRMGYGMQGAGATQGALGQYTSILGAPLAMTGAAGQVGAQQQAMDQQLLDADRAKYAYDAQRAQLGLQNYMAGISGEYGGTSTATGPGGPNPMLTALAGGIGMAAGGPIGAAAGQGLASLWT